MDQSLLHREDVFIDGKWCPPTTSAVWPVVDPATRQDVGSVPACGAAEVDTAVAAARRAFDGWAATPLEHRLDLLNRLQDGILARAGDFLGLLAVEVGAPVTPAQGLQFGLALATIASYVAEAKVFEFEQRVENSLVVREPVGVVACITPWNVPLPLILQKVVPALAVGCTVVLKPSELAPLNAFLLADIVAEAGFPAGVFNLVSGDGPTAGEALAAHPDVDMVSLTGSTRAGRRVAELAATTVKRVQLELGGKSANIILDDASFDQAVRVGVDQLFANSGQTCLAWSRMFVPRERHDEVVALAVDAASRYVVGDPRDPDTELGPLASQAAYDRVRAHIAAGVEEGATLALGGLDVPPHLSQGWYVMPTIFGDVRNDMAIAREEVFGPVLSIIPFDSDDDAVRMANDSPYGLHGAVWSGSDERATAVALRLRTGQVDVNGAPYNMSAPFGGYKQSGYGRQCGVLGLEEYVQVKSVQLPVSGNTQRGLVRLKEA